MDVRTIAAADITAAVKKLFMDCNYFIGRDILQSLETALGIEDSPVAKSVLSQIIENDQIAAREEIPLCQDTGLAVLFVEYGDKVAVDGCFEDAVQQGVREAYIDGYLRKSVVSDPVFDRVNTRDNTPAVIHTKIVSGSTIRFTAGGKGFGSENMSAIKMLTPAYGVEGVKQFILDTVRTAGPNPCPPIVVGVGIGGTFERHRSGREHRNRSHSYRGNARGGQHLLSRGAPRKRGNIGGCYGKKNHTSPLRRGYTGIEGRRQRASHRHPDHRPRRGAQEAV